MNKSILKAIKWALSYAIMGAGVGLLAGISFKLAAGVVLVVIGYDWIDPYGEGDK